MRIANILKGIETHDYLCVNKTILDIYLRAVKKDEPDLMKFKFDLLSTKGTSNVVPLPEGILSRLIRDKILTPYSRTKPDTRSVPLIWGVVEIRDNVFREETPIALLTGSTDTIAVPWSHISSKNTDEYSDYYHMDKMIAMGICNGVYTNDSIANYKWNQFTANSPEPYAIPYLIDGFTGGGSIISPMKWIRYSTNPFSLDIFVPIILDCTDMEAFTEVNLYRNTIIKYVRGMSADPFFKSGRKFDEYSPRMIGSMLSGQDSEVLDVIWKNKTKMLDFYE